MIATAWSVDLARHDAASKGVFDMTDRAIDAILARLFELHPRKIDLSINRTLRLLATLGDPHKRLPKTIHVAGTNGKGSTIAFLRAPSSRPPARACMSIPRLIS